MADFREVVICDHILTICHPTQNLKSKQVVVLNTKQFGHKKQLAKNIRQIEALDEQVKNYQVVSEPLSCPEKNVSKKALYLIFDGAHFLYWHVFGANECINVAGKKLHELIPLFIFLDGLEFISCVHIVDNFNATLVI